MNSILLVINNLIERKTSGSQFRPVQRHTPYIKRLSFQQSFRCSKGYLNRDRSTWSSLISHARITALLPNLQTIYLRLSEPPDPRQPLIKQVDILVPLTLSSFQCSIAGYLSAEPIWPLIYLVILRCIRLLQLKLSTYINRGEGQKYWELLIAQDAPQHLDSLSLNPPICDNRVLPWVAQAPGLKHLSIDLSDISDIHIPSGLFQELRFLRVASKIGPFFVLIVANSPLLSEFHLRASPLISIIEWDKLRSLPLRSLRMTYALLVPGSRCIFRRIAGFWPKLKRPYLQVTPIALDELVCISRYLAQLMELAVKIPGGYLAETIRAPRLSPTVLDAQRAVWVSHSFILTPNPSFYEDYRFEVRIIVP